MGKKLGKKVKQKRLKGSQNPEENAARNQSKLPKMILIGLGVLNLFALGGWLYLEFGELKRVDKTLAINRRGVVRARKQMNDLLAVAATIRNNRFGRIDDPGVLIMEIAEGLGLQGKVKAGRRTAKRWKTSNYQEITVPITFIGKEGYEFGGLIRFLQSIEKKNPKLLIKEMNFGRREKGGDDLGPYDRWRPSGAALVVRTFRLKT